MVIASYEPTAFEEAMGIVIIIAVLVIIIVYHTLLIRKILDNKKSGKGKRIIGMVVVAAFFWILAYIPMLMGFVNVLNYGFAIFARSSLFLIPILLYFLGAFLICVGAGLGYSIAFGKDDV